MERGRGREKAIIGKGGWSKIISAGGGGKGGTKEGKSCRWHKRINLGRTTLSKKKSVPQFVKSVSEVCLAVMIQKKREKKMFWARKD